MSDNDGWRTADRERPAASVSYGWQGTPMALDRLLFAGTIRRQYDNEQCEAQLLCLAHEQYAWRLLPSDLGRWPEPIRCVRWGDNAAAVIDLRPATLKYELGGEWICILCDWCSRWLCFTDCGEV